MYNILVCDDEKDIVEALGIYLSAEGYQVTKAYNGQEACEKLKTEDVHHDAGDGWYHSDEQDSQDVQCSGHSAHSEK